MLCGWIAFPGSPHAVVDICLTDDVSRETAAAPTPSRRGLAGSPSAGVEHDAAGVTPQRTVVGRTSCGERAHRQRRARPPYLVPRSHEPARPPSAVRKLAIPLRRIPAPVPPLDHIAPVCSRISAGHATPARPARSAERFPFHVKRDQLRLPENARAAAYHLPMQPRRAVGQSRVRRGTHPCTAPVHRLCITARCPQTAPKGGSRPPSPWQPSVPNALACGRPRPVFSASALSSRATSGTRATDRRSVTRVIAMETRMSTGSPQDVDKPAVDKAFTTTLRHAPSNAARSSTHTAHRRHPSSGAPGATDPTRAPPSGHPGPTALYRAAGGRRSILRPPESAASPPAPSAQEPAPGTTDTEGRPHSHPHRQPTRDELADRAQLARHVLVPTISLRDTATVANRPQLGRPLLTSGAPGPTRTHARDVRSQRSTLPAGSDERRHPARGPHPPRPWSPAAVREVRPDRPAHGRLTGRPSSRQRFTRNGRARVRGRHLARSQPHRGVR